ncbi:ral guanine nucleotide dissociation stimulator-like [Tupaia chinensis]|uniref:ral guanine nucleotide dissociation stimulator-like n=1 Tax=Tupaia chinensis TaxID=246437 RepID=UPI0003C8FA64|nr:ral guanine nucleotide dissociation stimulator-like [Tupaia chinensis]
MHTSERRMGNLCSRALLLARGSACQGSYVKEEGTTCPPRDAFPASSRYGQFLWDVEEDEQVKSVICSLLSTWLDDYLDDFYEPPDFPGLETLAEYVSTIAPGSHLDRRAHIVLAEAVVADHLHCPLQFNQSRATSPSPTTGAATVAREEPEPPVPGALAVASLPGEGPVPAAPRKALARAQSAPTLSQTTRADHSPSPTHDHDGCPRHLCRHIILTIIITLTQNAG